MNAAPASPARSLAPPLTPSSKTHRHPAHAAAFALAALALIAALAASPAAATTLDVRVTASADDAEEFATGNMYLTSTDLELIHDTSDQTVGMRWVGLPIPPGATITAAWIQFAAKEAQSETTTVTFRGQADDNAPAFTTTSANISPRPRTAAATTWIPAPWLAGETGANQRTPDLSAVIREIVRRPGWASGNALVIIVNGTGHRTAYSFDGKAAGAPLLHIEYTTGPVTEAPPVARLSVSQLASPALTVRADGSTSTDGDATPIATYAFTFGDGATAGPAASATAQHTYATSGTYTVTLVCTDTGGNVSNTASASITVSPPSPPPSAATVEARTGASADDAEESASGSTNITSGDLELIHDSSDQTVGMRWGGLAIPAGANITAAWIQFASKEAWSETTTVTLRGQAADNAPAFATSSLNVSSRQRTTAAATWIPVPWLAGETGPNERTPDLSQVVQEVVRRPGWASGNALAIIVSGVGHRTAYSFDGKAASAPLLHVEYTTGPVTEAAPLARLSASQVPSPPLTVMADGSASTDNDGTPIATYRFTFGDGATAGPAASATAQHTYATAGMYTVTLICTDTGGNVSNTASTTVNVVAAPPSGGGTIAVFGGYFDTHHPHLLKPKPDPWRGSANTVFVGAPDKAGGNDWDSSALRVDNLTAGTLSGVVVTADIGSHHYALWGTNSIPPGYHLVLAQTAFENFDGSDRNAAGCFDCNPNDCLTKVSSVVPVVHVTVGGTTTTYYDTGQQLNTNGVDAAGCPYTGQRNDESENWEQLPTQLEGNYAVHRDAAGTVTMVVPADRALWLGTPFPNPSHGRLTIEFRIADTGEVRLGMYDLAGRLVRGSVKGILGPGDYRDDLDLSDLAAGAYFCRLDTPEGELHRTFMIVR